MSRYLVGLDFGTHQSKVCIEDSANKAQKTYEFLEFPDAPNGKEKTLFPSIVQVNRDDTVSYGFVDPREAKIIAKEGIAPPEMEVIPEPEYLPIPKEPRYDKLPPKPDVNHQGYLAVLAKLLPDSDEIRTWKRECESIERSNGHKKWAWENNKRDIESKNEKLKQKWLKEVEESETRYEEAMEKWRDDSNQSIQARFRYFKQATFFYRDIWTNDFISPEEASIWYLAYIRFLLIQKLGKEFTVHMGVPCSYADIAEFKQRAYNLWMCAGKIVDHYKNLKTYLKASYEELQEIGKYENFTIDPDQPFDVRTEAQASLFAAVSNERIDSKINLLFDIGGGTTDIAVFHISEDKQLKILETISVPYGLNYIFETYQKEHKDKTLEQIQSLFAKYITGKSKQGEFDKQIDSYLQEIEGASSTLTLAIIKAIQRDPATRLRSQVINAIQRNPSVFCGGGSLYESLKDVSPKAPGLSGQRGDMISVFTDRRVVDRELLGIRNVKNKDIKQTTYQILAASYGLSLSDNWFEVPSENILDTFKAPDNAKPLVKTILFDRNDEAIK